MDGTCNVEGGIRVAGDGGLGTEGGARSSPSEVVVVVAVLFPFGSIKG